MTKQSDIFLISASKINELFPMKTAIEIIEKSFIEYSKKQSIMSKKNYLDLTKYKGDFRAMPAYCEATGYAGVKWVNSHPENIKSNKLSVMGLIILNSPETGEPLAIVEGTLLTNIRTGAAGAVAARAMADPKSETVALIGTGTQAHYQLSGLLECFPVKTINLFDINQESAEAFKNTIINNTHCTVNVKTSIRNCVSDADIIVTTTPARKALIRKEWLKDNYHINAIGADAPGKQEVHLKVIQNSIVVVDDIEQATHSGEINIPIATKQLSKNQIFSTLGDLFITKKDHIKSLKEKPSVFDSTGLAIQDIYAAGWIFNKINKLDTPSYNFFNL